MRTAVKLIYVIFFSWLCFLSEKAVAQQQAMYTQYMFNGLAINPAYAGSQESLSLTALARKQWSGIEGAPSTQTFSAHSPFNEDKIGVGILLLHDKIGLTEQTAIYGSYAYKIKFNNNNKTLSFGLQAGFNHYSAEFSKVSSTDPAFANQDVNQAQPNFGFGLYYSTEHFYAGASVPQLLNNTLGQKNNRSGYDLVRHYFFTTGYLFNLNESLKLKPTLLVKAIKGAPMELDLNTSLLIKELVWVGISWRSFKSINALLQLQLTNKLQVGYAYDIATTSELRSINAGSHEVMLNYRLGLWQDKIITPRHF